jgi:hypothetical protein
MMPYRIGADARCTDGACGQVSRIILNPVTREVTHLAVDPKHRTGPGRLVPADLVDAATGQIRLGCTLANLLRTSTLQHLSDIRRAVPAESRSWPVIMSRMVRFRTPGAPDQSRSPVVYASRPAQNRAGRADRA